MKRYRLLAAAAALLLALAGCAGEEGSLASSQSGTPEASQSASQSPDSAQGGSAASGETVEGTPEENEVYAEAYLKPVAAGLLLRTDFGPGNMQTLWGSVLIQAFEDLTGREQMEKYWAEYDGDFPQEVVEDCLTAHFDLTPEDLRENLLASCYLSEEEVYQYYGGRGGGPVDVRVDASRRTGDLLELDFTILTVGMGDDGDELSPFSRGTMVIRLGEDGSWKYLQNQHQDLPQGFGTAAEQGVVSRDGLSYENAALGLSIQLPQGSPAATFSAVDFTPVEDPGVYLTVYFEDSPALAAIQAMTHSDYEARQAKEEAGVPQGGILAGENSRWAFVISYARSNPNLQPEETPGYEEFTAWLEETIPGCITIREPAA
jgi:hypothetical protein